MERLRLPTYRQVWSLERVIYKIEGVRLPMAVSFRQAGVFAATAIAMAILSRVSAIGAVSPAVRYILVPALVTWYLTRQSLDGRPPHRWLWVQIRFWLGPRRLLRFRAPAREPQRLRMRASVWTRTGSTGRGNPGAVSDHLS